MPYPRWFKITVALGVLGLAAVWVLWFAAIAPGIEAAHAGAKNLFSRFVDDRLHHTAAYYRDRAFFEILQNTIIALTSIALVSGIWRPRPAAFLYGAAGIFVCVVAAFVDIRNIDGASASVVAAKRAIKDVIYREGSAAEVCSSLGYFLASVFFLRAFLTRRPRPVWCLVFAILFFAFAGEEISWGQRILGFGTPESMKGVNNQNEFNLHNLHGKGWILDLKHTAMFNAGFLLLVINLFCLAPLARGDVDRMVRLMRGLFFGAAVYMLVGALWPRRDGQEFMHRIFGEATALMILLGATAPYWLGKGPLRRALEALVKDIRFSPEFFRCALWLVLVWVAMGIRFKTLGDLWIKTDYDSNIDDEFVECFGGLLAMLLGRIQSKAP